MGGRFLPPAMAKKYGIKVSGVVIFVCLFLIVVVVVTLLCRGLMPFRKNSI